jgi:hypothetical protein
MKIFSFIEKYQPGVAEKVLRHRNYWKELPPELDCVAVASYTIITPTYAEKHVPQDKVSSGIGGLYWQWWSYARSFATRMNQIPFQ